MRRLSSSQRHHFILTLVLMINIFFLSACEINEDEVKTQAIGIVNKSIQFVKSPEAQKIFEKTQQSLSDLLDDVGEDVSDLSKEAINQMLQELDEEINVNMPEIAPIITQIVNDEINNFVNDLNPLGDSPDNIIEQYIYDAAESAARAAIIAVVNDLSLDLNQSDIDQVARFVARVAAHKVFLIILEDNPTIKMALIVQRVMIGFNGELLEQLVLKTLAALSVPSGNSLLIGKTAIIYNTGSDRLNCRIAPGTNSEIIAKLSKGNEVTLREGPIKQEDFDWWQLETKNKPLCWAAGNWLLVQ